MIVSEKTSSYVQQRVVHSWFTVYICVCVYVYVCALMLPCLQEYNEEHGGKWHIKNLRLYLQVARILRHMYEDIIILLYEYIIVHIQDIIIRVLNIDTNLILWHMYEDIIILLSIL